jgi:hypothetical protein
MDTSPIVLDFAPDVSVIRPTPEGTLSRRGIGLSWTPSGRLVDLTLRDATRGHVDFRARAVGEGITFGRLERLGIAALDVGAHVLEVATRDDANVDDIVDEAPAGARALRPAGHASFDRYLFTVTP